ncbi:MAG: hypothetical protein ACYCQJ_13850 [Nitrososphaerales archaeon]
MAFVIRKYRGDSNPETIPVLEDKEQFAKLMTDKIVDCFRNKQAGNKQCLLEILTYLNIKHNKTEPLNVLVSRLQQKLSGEIVESSEPRTEIDYDRYQEVNEALLKNPEVSEKTKWFIRKAQAKHRNRYDYSYVVCKKSDDKVKIFCFRHEIFTQRADNHYYTGSNCPKCVGKSHDSEYHEGELDKICNEKGGKRHSPYVNNHDDMAWECKDHHHWLTSAISIKTGRWCPRCSESSRDPVFHEAELDRICTEKGGKRHSPYVTATDPMEWECRDKHHWFTAASNIKTGHWCHYCSGTFADQEYHEAELDKICSEKGGKRHSPYVKTDEDMEWECREKHRWYAMPAKIKVGHWCHYCAGNSNDPQIHEPELDRICTEKKGKRHSPYINSLDPMEWECADNHHWFTSASNIKAGRWCHYCAGNSSDPEYHEAELDRICAEKGGKRHSSYINAIDPMKWECRQNHHWVARSNDIKNGHWCPSCRIFKNQETCKRIIEELIGRPFEHNKKPEFLRYLTGKKLEIDIYLEDLKLGVEYNGVQHYMVIDHFYPNGEYDLIERQKRDRFKYERCVEEGIDLIVIPYTYKTDEQKRAFIIEELRRICLKRGVTQLGSFQLS